MNFESLKKYCEDKKGCTTEFPFGPDTMVFKVAKKMFGLIPIDEDILRINLKGIPADNLQLREKYPAILPGYHMNKLHWNTIVVDGRISNDKIQEMIDLSYELVYNKLTKAAREQIEKL